MNIYLRNLFGYFENVLHPAGGWSSESSDKRKRKTRRSGYLQVSPDEFNTRANIKKGEKHRRNPAP